MIHEFAAERKRERGKGGGERKNLRKEAWLVRRGGEGEERERVENAIKGGATMNLWDREKIRPFDSKPRQKEEEEEEEEFLSSLFFFSSHEFPNGMSDEGGWLAPGC